MPKNTKSGQAMAFVTLEDLVGTVEVLLFPKTYMQAKPEIFTGNKVLIKGKATVGSEEQGKLIADTVLGFDKIRREIWFRFRDYEDYKLQEKYLLSLSSIEEMAGDTQVVIYLADTKQVKRLDRSCSIRTNNEILKMLRARYGESNVQVNIKKTC